MREMDRLMEEYWNEMDEKERQVYEVICDSILETDYPPCFFDEHTTQELNAHFGGHDDMIITEKVRCALALYLDEWQMWQGIREHYDELPEVDDGDQIG